MKYCLAYILNFPYKIATKISCKVNFALLFNILFDTNWHVPCIVGTLIMIKNLFSKKYIELYLSKIW